MSIELALVPLFFLVAALYASVGHAGASGYLALMALAGFAPARTDAPDSAHSERRLRPLRDHNLAGRLAETGV